MLYWSIISNYSQGSYCCYPCYTVKKNAVAAKLLLIVEELGQPDWHAEATLLCCSGEAKGPETSGTHVPAVENRNHQQSTLPSRLLGQTQPEAVWRGRKLALEVVNVAINLTQVDQPLTPKSTIYPTHLLHCVLSYPMATWMSKRYHDPK